MKMLEDPEITTMSEKGQVVIPQELRKHLGIKPKTKFIVYAVGDNIIMRKLDMPDIKKEWKSIFQTIDRKHLRLEEKEIAKEVKSNRKEKRRKSTG